MIGMTMMVNTTMIGIILLILVRKQIGTTAFLSHGPDIGNVNGKTIVRGVHDRSSHRRHGTALWDARRPVLQLALDRMQILQTRCCLPGGKVSPVHVKASSIPNAGVGLFARTGIPTGSIVSLYPVHAIGIDTEGRGDTVYLSSSSTGDDNASPRDYGLDYIQYLMGSRPLGDTVTSMGGGVFVDAHPSKRDDADGWLSHYINDGATVASNTEHGILQYYADSRERKNCVQVPFGPSPVLVTVTTRPIERGEELFTSYGCFYWLEKILPLPATTMMPRDVDDEECTEITESVLLQAKGTAQDIFQAMQSCRIKYKDHEEYLYEAFYGAS